LTLIDAVRDVCGDACSFIAVTTCIVVTVITLCTRLMLMLAVRRPASRAC